MRAKCIQQTVLNTGNSSIIFTSNESYEFIRSLAGGTVIVKNGEFKVKLNSETFDSSFISIQELRDNSLDALLEA